MRPLLALHADGLEHVNRDVVDTLARQFGLTEQERREMLPSGRGRLIDNRIGWAKNRLLRSNLLDMPKRGISVITERGIQMLQLYPDKLDQAALKEAERISGKETISEIETDHTHPAEAEASSENLPPEELLEDAYQKVRRQIEADLLRLIMENPPDFLERVVVDLIVGMGYGGSRKDAGEALGKTGDEGIDGIIKEDPLGLDIIYLQAKRWDSTVGRPEIQKFAGALQGQRAKKGIFITTSTFSVEARDFASKIDSKIILIDGSRLVRLMFDHGIGVATATTYAVKKVDSDYFAEI